MEEESAGEEKEPESADEEKEPAAPESRPSLLPTLSAAEWRLFAITAVAGVASIVVGAAVIGISLALARAFWKQQDAWWTFVAYVAAGVLGVALGVTGWRPRSRWRPLHLPPFSGREAMVYRQIMFWTGVLVIAITVLVLIGKAAGIH